MPNLNVKVGFSYTVFKEAVQAPSLVATPFWKVSWGTDASPRIINRRYTYLPGLAVSSSASLNTSTMKLLVALRANGLIKRSSNSISKLVGGLLFLDLMYFSILQPSNTRYFGNGLSAAVDHSQGSRSFLSFSSLSNPFLAVKSGSGSPPY